MDNTKNQKKEIVLSIILNIIIHLSFLIHLRQNYWYLFLYN